MVGEEEALARDFLITASKGSPESALGSQFLPRKDLQDVSLSHEDLVHVQQDVTAADDDPLKCQVLADVLRLTDFVVHLLREFLQFALRVVQTPALDVIVRRVSQQFVQRNDVPGNL